MKGYITMVVAGILGAAAMVIAAGTANLAVEIFADWLGGLLEEVIAAI